MRIRQNVNMTRIKMNCILRSWPLKLFGMIFLVTLSSHSQVLMPNAKVKALPEKPLQLELNLKEKKSLIKIFAQADSIIREASWLLTEKRKVKMSSPFGRIQRAFMISANQKLTKLPGLKCDRYGIQNGIDLKISFNCEKKPVSFAQVSGFKQKHITVSFETLNLADSLGIAASIYGKPIVCQIQVNSENELLRMDCNTWVQDRFENQLVVLSELQFSKKENDQLVMKGEVLENLKLRRKIDVKVPISGKIKLSEIELPRPEDQIISRPPVKVLTPIDNNSESIPQNSENTQQAGGVRDSSTPGAKEPPKNGLPEPEYIEEDFKGPAPLRPKEPPDPALVPEQENPETQTSPDSPLPNTGR